jgi:hypothetical protein
MLHFNNLMYYSLPRLPKNWKPPAWLTIELGILAGRFYFEFAEYAALANYLGLVEMDLGDFSSTTTNADGIKNEEGKGRATRSFTEKPLSFLQEWLAVRRKGQDFVHTPMGYVCQGGRLKPSHPFFVARKALKADTDGMTAKTGQGGTTSGSGGGNAGYESDGSIDLGEDEVGFGDKNINGYSEGDGY